jgi:hypothetical protein
MPHSGEGRQRFGRNRVEELAGVPEVLGQTSSHLEVKRRVPSAGDMPIHVLDRRLQARSVHERTRVELWQRLRV